MIIPGNESAIDFDLDIFVKNEFNFKNFQKSLIFIYFIPYN